MSDALYVKTASGPVKIDIGGSGSSSGTTEIEVETYTITETATTPQSYSIGVCAYVMVFVNSVLGIDGTTYGITGGTVLQFTDVLPVGTEVVIVKFISAGSVTPTPSYAIDSALSATSTNAVQNKVITASINSLQASIDSAYAKYVTELG